MGIATINSPFKENITTIVNKSAINVIGEIVGINVLLAGCMVVLKNRTESKIQIAIERISEPEVRDMMKANFSILHRTNGSEQVADWILEQIN